MTADWMIAVGLLVGLLGLWGLIAGGWYSDGSWGGKSLPPLDRPVYQSNYYGRALPAVVFVIGALLVGIYFLFRVSSPRVAESTANITGVITCAVGIVLSIVVAIRWPGKVVTTQIGKAPGLPHMSLSEAARYLKIPESDLLEMVHNNTVEARNIDGRYFFDEEVLGVLRDTLQSSRNG